MPYINVVVSSPSGSPNPALARTIAQGVTERTTRILRKRPEVTSVSVSFVGAEQWFVDSRSLGELGLATFWLDIAVTEGTNTKEEKAAYLAEIVSFMGASLGPLHGTSYVRVMDVRAEAWGYGGVSQEVRAAQTKGAATVQPSV